MQKERARRQAEVKREMERGSGTERYHTDTAKDLGSEQRECLKL